MRNLSLKTRMALAVSTLFIAFTTAMAAFTLSHFEREFKKTISDQQFSLVSSLANSIDDKLRIAQKALITGAARISPEDVKEVEKAQRFLDSRPTLHSLFDNGLFLISRTGILIAESPYRPGRRGRDISFREFYQKTVTTGKPQISTPYLSTHNPGHPAIMLTAPVFDKSGSLVAILGGSFDLLGENLLRDIAVTKIGTTGYLYLCGKDRTLIVHPDKSQIMKPGAPAGVNTLFDKTLTGFDGSGETVTSRGISMLASFKHLGTTDWILAANYPVSEAYAPIEKARRNFMTATIASTAVLLIIAWLLMKRLMSPLLAITRHVESMPEKSGAQKLIPFDSRDEIGTLAQAFNRMVNALEGQQEAMSRAIERAENEKSKSDAIITALGDGISIQDRNFRVIYQNKAHQELSGGDHRGAYCYRAYSCIDHVCEGCPVALCFQDGQVHRLGKAAGSPANNAAFIEITASPLRDPDGNVVASIELVRDVSQRKRIEDEVLSLNASLEQRVRERTAELEASNRELEAFCHSVSHDLRTPLRGIDGFSRILMEESGEKLDAAGKGHLERIGAAAVRMGELIDGLLNLSRLTRSEMHRNTVDLSALVRDIAVELKHYEPARMVEFIIADSVSAEGDARLLRVVLENLLGNAWKFCGKQPAATIEFGTCDTEAETVYFIRDNGVGFDMAYAHKLFNPFERLHSIHEFEGTGIGLATVHRIINRHGGRIWVEAELDKGATFFFTLSAQGGAV